jgi:hypothetical protein
VPRATIRASVANYLQQGSDAFTGEIPFLSNVYPHFPKYTPEPELFSANLSGTATGVVIYLYIESHSEERHSSAGTHGGRKWRTYQFVLMCYLKSTKQEAEAASCDNDTFTDGLTAWIQADRNLGTAPGTTGYVPSNAVGPSATGYIFQAGEGGRRGGDDLRVHSQIPLPLDDATTAIYTGVDLTVCEILNT